MANEKELEPGWYWVTYPVRGSMREPAPWLWENDHWSSAGWSGRQFDAVTVIAPCILPKITEFSVLLPTDHQCDTLVEMAIKHAAGKFSDKYGEMNPSDLNKDIEESHTLRREIVRSAFLLGTQNKVTK